MDEKWVCEEKTMKKKFSKTRLLILLFGMMSIITIPTYSCATVNNVQFCYPDNNGVVAYEFYDTGTWVSTLGIEISTVTNVTKTIKSVSTLYTEINATEKKWSFANGVWEPGTAGIMELGAANDSLNFYVCTRYGANLIHSPGITGAELNESYYRSHYPTEGYFGCIFDTIEVGNNWTRYTSPWGNQGMLYIEVRPDGWVQNFTLIDMCAASSVMYIFNPSKSDHFIDNVPAPVLSLKEKTCLKIDVYVKDSVSLDNVSSLTVNWGDSNYGLHNNIPTQHLTHTYAVAGIYCLNVTIVDGDGDSMISTNLQVNVTTICPTNTTTNSTSTNSTTTSTNTTGTGGGGGYTMPGYLIAIIVIAPLSVISLVIYMKKKKSGPSGV
jgi:hypothetical protein